MSATEPLPKLLKARIRHSWVAGVAVLLALLVTDGAFPYGGVMRVAFEWLAYAALVLAVLGRGWCAAYIGGRKKYELIKLGPYSVTRNPLYVFSFVGIVGIGFATGMITYLILLPVVFVLYYRVVVRREEAYLLAAFGKDYENYMLTVPRWWPNFESWRDADEITVKPHYLRHTLRDSAAFFLALPLLQFIQYLHAVDVLPVLLYLP